MNLRAFKTAFLSLLCGIWMIPASGQARYAVDTTFHRDTACGRKIHSFWYVKGKYPESARRLAAQADAAIPDEVRVGLTDGFINLQFLVSCKGITTAYRLSQTDRQYRPVRYPAAVIDALYGFVQSLKGWKGGSYEGEPVYYRAYFAFKIKNGHVVEVSP